MKDCILTGGTGHIGNVTAKLLADSGYRVKAILLPGEDPVPIERSGAEIVRGDVLDTDFLAEQIPEGGLVFHLAGIVDIGSSGKDRLYQVNVQGTKNVADICLKKHVEKLVYTSSVHTVDPGKKQGILVEPLVFDEQKIVGDYAKSKTIATGYVFDLVKRGLNAVVVYPGGVIGPYDYKLSNFGQLIVDIMNGEIKARVSGAYNFVDVRDVARGILLAAEKGRVGEGYLLSGNKVTLDELFLMIDAKLGRLRHPPKLAMWFVRMFARMAELYYKVRKKRPIFSAYSLYTLTANCNFANDKAVKELGFSVRPAKESLDNAVDWFRQNRPELLTNGT